jgi:hypothetical protein
VIVDYGATIGSLGIDALCRPAAGRGKDATCDARRQEMGSLWGSVHRNQHLVMSSRSASDAALASRLRPLRASKSLTVADILRGIPGHVSYAVNPDETHL